MSLAESGSDPTIKNITEYHKIEINEIFTRTRALMSARVQLFSVMGTAHLTIIGIAFTVQKAILIYIAAVMMLFLMKIDSVIESIIEALIARGLQLEMLYSDDEEPLWASIVSSVSQKKIEPRILALKLSGASTQVEIIQRIKSRATKKIGIWLPISAFIFECIGGLFLWKLNILQFW